MEFFTMKITKSQLRQIIIEQIEEAKHTDYRALGVKDGFDGKEEYHSIALFLQVYLGLRGQFLHW